MVDNDFTIVLVALKEARDWLAIQSSSTDSFCEMCEHHAPKDENGLVVGPIQHADDCPLGRADAVITKYDNALYTVLCRRVPTRLLNPGDVT